ATVATSTVITAAATLIAAASAVIAAAGLVAAAAGAVQAGAGCRGVVPAAAPVIALAGGTGGAEDASGQADRKHNCEKPAPASAQRRRETPKGHACRSDSSFP